MTKRSDFEVSTLIAPTADDEILVLHGHDVRRVRLDHLAGSGVWVLPSVGAAGPAGADGAPGPAGADGADGADPTVPGPPGADGADGVGVPAGGTTGQVLAKNSNTDYDTEWVAPGGGSTVTEIEVDFGSSTRRSKSFTITDATVTGASKIVAYQSGNPATGRGRDDAAWDSITYAAIAGTGSFTLIAHSTGRVKGPRNVYYTVS